MVLEVIALGGAAVVTLALGLFALSQGVGERRWRLQVAEFKEKIYEQVHEPPAFEPLEMEDFSMRWPSEVDVGVDRIPLPDLPWPSETWDDPYFGPGRSFDPDELPAPIEQTSALRSEAARSPEPSRTPEPATSPRRALEAARDIGRSAAEEAFFGDGSALPSPREIRALVDRRGLAGAVQDIRERTGWDFKKAARYLAQVMRDQ